LISTYGCYPGEWLFRFVTTGLHPLSFNHSFFSSFIEWLMRIILPRSNWCTTVVQLLCTTLETWDGSHVGPMWWNPLLETHPISLWPYTTVVQGSFSYSSISQLWMLYSCTVHTSMHSYPVEHFLIYYTQSFYLLFTCVDSLMLIRENLSLRLICRINVTPGLTP
jgi:hypothetical protein